MNRPRNESLHRAQKWGCCPPCTWEMSNWCACLPWECLCSRKRLFWGWAGVRRCLFLKILECVLSQSSLLTSDFYHFSLLVPPQLDTKLVCHLPALLTCRCCFPALRETKLLGVCSRCWKLCGFYFYFLVCPRSLLVVQACTYPHAALCPHALPTEELWKKRSKKIFHRH